jgi:hypothetical protein
MESKTISSVVSQKTFDSNKTDKLLPTSITIILDDGYEYILNTNNEQEFTVLIEPKKDGSPPVVQDVVEIIFKDWITREKRSQFFKENKELEQKKKQGQVIDEAMKKNRLSPEIIVVINDVIIDHSKFDQTRLKLFGECVYL